MVTNPFYVIKTRMYTSSYNNSSAYRGLFDGMNKIIASEGVLGLWKGTLLALGTVANSALQFTIYEEMKKVRFSARHSQPGVNDKLVGSLVRLHHYVLIVTAKLGVHRS